MHRPVRTLLIILSALVATLGVSSVYPAQQRQPMAQSATETPPPPPPPPTPVPTATPRPMPATSADALALPRGTAPKRLAAVMIDNHPNAYPQSGLDKAVIVFEALAEYGISRYMAIFAPGISPDVNEIGPVRSARSYFVEWAKGFDVVYAHAGGSPEGLTLAQTSIEILNMDALRNEASAYFWRSKERYAPHNLYTKSSEIERFIQAKKATNFDPTEHGFLYADTEALRAERPTAQTINYYLLYKTDLVGWSYDPPTNTYLRLRGSKPYLDARTKKQLQFKNVVVMEVHEAEIPNDPKKRIDQQVIGTGTARIFLDGKSINGTWRKEAGYASLRFYGTDGQEIRLNYGSTWIAVLPSLNNLTVK